MRTLTKDEQAKRQLTVDKNQVAIVHTVKPDKDSDNRYELSWTLDFENVKREELLQLAARSVLIALQSQWRKAADRMKADVWDNRTFSVREFIDTPATRTARPLKDRLAEKAKDMSEEERAELIAILQGKN